MLADLKDMLINFLTFWGFILFTVLCWFTFQFNRKDSFSYAVLKSFAFTSFQFYIVDLILSVFSVLRFAVVVNMLISAILIMLSLKKLSEILGVAKQKVFSFISAIGRRNLVLSLMVLAFYMYLGVISYYFPVRGTDDLGYRLPIILESVRKSGIVIPSPKCDARFAFPQFTYPIYKIYLLITGGERFLDFTNIYFLLILIISVYCISVFVRARTDVAFFMSSLLLPVTPVVVGQTTSNYVDLAFASFLIGAIAIALKLVKGAKKEGKERNISDAVACGIFLGGLCGIKYTGLFFIPLVEYFIILSGNVRIFVVFNVVLFITMCFWYFVNLVNFGFPIWPVPGSPLDPYPNITKFSLHEVKHLLAFLKYDNIELSYHKGFGTAFWFLTLPLALKFAISKIKNRAFLLAFILAFIPLLYITWRIV